MSKELFMVAFVVIVLAFSVIFISRKKERLNTISSRFFFLIAVFFFVLSFFAYLLGYQGVGDKITRIGFFVLATGLPFYLFEARNENS